jgi:acetylornithine deacetylase
MANTKIKENKEVEKLLLDLIKIPSESENEKEIGEFLSNRLSKDFIVKKQIVNEKKGNFNILAYVGSPKILLNAHLDTVPGQLRVYDDSENIYGRGACDTKASMASMILAAENALKDGLTDFGLLFNVNEEGDFSGIKKALEIIPKSVEYIIIGEPTSLEVVYGQKGILVFKIISNGKTAHGSTPELGENAIEKLMSNLVRLKEMNLPISKDLGKNNLNIAKISGGIADNVVPDYAESQIAIRCAVSPDLLIKQLEKEMRDVKIEVAMKYEPVVDSFVSVFSEKINVPKKTVSYFTEMYFLSKKAKCFVFGPGDGKYAHSIEERVEKLELAKAVEKYKEIITLLNTRNIDKLSKELI